MEPDSFVSAIDAWTLAVAFVVVAAKAAYRHRNAQGPAFSRNACINDLLNGSVIVPFCAMIGSVFSQSLLAYAHTGSLLNGLAGAVGLFFIAGELLAAPH